MDRRYRDIQSSYLAEMRAIKPAIMDWWRANSLREPGTVGGPSAENSFDERWPAGPAAHPRVLHIFRKFFLDIERLNDENSNLRTIAVRPIEESDWGSDGEPEEVEFQLPIDLLVDDLRSAAPDVYELVKGMVFVPIGESPNGESC